uniref:chondroitin sulfate proteoglycan 4-like n=1 Tax=Myxine glutinosa TaxID=7769 RepID=UPI00358E9714
MTWTTVLRVPRPSDLLVPLVLLCAASLCRGASFFGESYVEVQERAALSQTHLALHFRTGREHGLLFLAAGLSNYLLLELRFGRLQLRLELGSGQIILRSEPGIKLNDLRWHSVDIKHEKYGVSLFVDGRRTNSAGLPGHLHELNVHYGLFVGGAGGLQRSYLLQDGDPVGFRGCIENVEFNSKDILGSLQPYAGIRTVHEVKAGCSAEFSARIDDEISFSSPKSYMVFRGSWGRHAGVYFECGLKTDYSNGLILYHRQPGNTTDFVAVELVRGYVRALVMIQGAMVTFITNLPIDDGHWHQLKLIKMGQDIDLTVDREVVRRQLRGKANGQNVKNFRSPNSPLYVGGVADSMRIEVRRKGLASMAWRTGQGSFRGCLRHLKIDDEWRGFQHLEVSRNVFVGCQKSDESRPFRATLDLPTLTSTAVAMIKPSTTTTYFTRDTIPDLSTLKITKLQMRPTTVVRFPTMKITNPITNTMTETVTTTLVAEHVILFSLFPLRVEEGGTALFNSRVLRINMDILPLGISPSQVLLLIVRGPDYGELHVNREYFQQDALSLERQQQSFSLLDVSQGQVEYVHHGAEEASDSLFFKVFSSNDWEGVPIPLQWAMSKEHKVDVVISPINDPPELSLPRGNSFSLLKNSRKLLTPDVVRAVDPDTSASHLTMVVLGNLNAGHFERAREQGRILMAFPYADLEASSIYFVHQGPVLSFRVALRASDGEKVSNTVVLHILAMSQEINIQKNTGITLSTANGVGRIFPSNLSIRINLAEEDQAVHFWLVAPPSRGEIQQFLPSLGHWKAVKTFTRQALENSHVRYVLSDEVNKAQNLTDAFKFKVFLSGQGIGEEHTFEIQIVGADIQLKNNMMTITETGKTSVGTDILSAEVFGVSAPSSQIMFQIASVPKHGVLRLRKKRLSEQSMFTQRDLEDKKVAFVLKKQPKRGLTDSFSFRVFFKKLSSPIYSFNILIKPGRPVFSVRNMGLEVLEGEQKLLTSKDLFIDTEDMLEYTFLVLQAPQHGTLMRLGLSGSGDIENNVTRFNSKDLLSQRLAYLHDDSESTEDQFTFDANPDSPDEAPAFTGIFNVTITPKNDHKPRRIVKKPFQVIRNGRRLFTSSDLWFEDADAGFDSGGLEYTRHGIPNGELVFTDNASFPLYHFRQVDLTIGKVSFVHRGADSGRFVVWVSDGKHRVTGLVEVLASDVFAHLAKSAPLHVPIGSSVPLTVAQLEVDTNLDIRDDANILFVVTKPPKLGKILQGAILADSFTQADVVAGQVAYKHYGQDGKSHDAFDFTVRVVGGAAGSKQVERTLHGTIHIHVILEDHHHALEVVHNDSLLVEEGQTATLSQKHLLVQHLVSSPKEIIFTLEKSLTHGYLKCMDLEKISRGPITSFSQLEVDEGRIHYVHTGPAQESDLLVLSVGNGVAPPLLGLHVPISIISHLVALVSTMPLVVTEGGAVALSWGSMLSAPELPSARQELIFTTLIPPRHGQLESTKRPGKALRYFSRSLVEQGFIYYVHDSSETRNDSFSLLANDTERERLSLPITIHVIVQPINDEAPVVYVNNGLKVWAETTVPLTTKELSSRDEDSDASNLFYSISVPSNGYVALKQAPHMPVLNFTQAHLEDGSLVFTHRGVSAGGFNFRVSDGANEAPRHIFVITAKVFIMTLKKNSGLRIYPGEDLNPITSQNLLVVTNDYDTTSIRTVLYTVVHRPRLGSIVHTSYKDTSYEVGNFTQSEVDAGLIAYRCGPMAQKQWNSQDSFQFSVSSPPGELPTHSFSVNMSYEYRAKGQSLFRANKGVKLIEGEKFLISTAYLDASNLLSKPSVVQRSSRELEYEITVFPRHGTLYQSENEISAERPRFSHHALAQHGVWYDHDGSDTLSDGFKVAVWVSSQSENSARPTDSVEEMVSVVVTAVDDELPHLLTKSPGIQLVQDALYVPITTEELHITDKDTPPEQLAYEVVQGPGNGYLVLARHEGKQPTVTFTQADINVGRLLFVPDGSSSSSVFYFWVADGTHKPIYSRFSISVEPVRLEVLNLTSMILRQGEMQAKVGPTNLCAETNSRSTEVTYEVSRPPRRGLLLVNGSRTETFAQSDVDAGNVIYHMSDHSAWEDSFEVDALTASINHTGLQIHVKVRPLLHTSSDFEVRAGSTVPLTLSVLDASELAGLTGDNPMFEVIGQPRYAWLLRAELSMRKRRNSENDVQIFSQDDVAQGLVLIRGRPSNTSVSGKLSDSFTFILRAAGVQAAAGEFVFDVVPAEPKNHEIEGSQEITVDAAELVSVLREHSTAISLSLPTVTTNTISNIKVYVTQATPPPTQNKNSGLERWAQDNQNLEEFEVTKAAVSSIPRVLEVASRSKRNLSVVIPLVLTVTLFVVFLAVIFGMWLWHQRRRSKDCHGFVTLKPNNLARGTTIRWPERSAAMPGVTVTALERWQTETSAVSRTPVLSRPPERSLPPSPLGSRATWEDSGRELLRQSPTTTPALGRNQYWV